MPQVIVLLRGINVGKAKRVAMAELRRLLTDLGYDNPRTLLNSGNAVIGCTAGQTRSAAATIRHGIAEQLGVDCAVLTRTEAELRRAIETNPIPAGTEEPARYLLGFLSGRPTAAQVRQFESGDYGTDELRIVGDTAYLWCRDGINDSPLTKLNWRSLGLDVTTRNWSTVLKLDALCAKG